MKDLKILFVTALLVLASFVPASGHTDPNDTFHTHHEDEHGTPGDEHGTPGDEHGTPGDEHGTPGDGHGTPGDEHGTPGDEHGGVYDTSLLADDGSQIIRQGTLIWPVQTNYPEKIVYLSFIDDSWDGIEDHTYADHTGIDIGNGAMSEQQFNLSKSAGYFGNVIAAADGEIVALVSDQGDFCYKRRNPNFLDRDGNPRAILVKTENCSGGCAEGNCFGNYVVIDHDPDGTLDLIKTVGYRYTSYAHLQTNSNAHLDVGEAVTQGEIIGKIGSSGNSEGPHLHFEVLKEELTPEDFTINENPDTQTWQPNPAYLSAVVDPFYSWQGGSNSSTSGFGRSMWSEQCNLPIYGEVGDGHGSVEPYLNLTKSGGCGSIANPCHFSTIQRPTDPENIMNACGGRFSREP